MSTPQSAVASPAAILLDGIAAAIAERPQMTAERKAARIAEVWAVIDAFGPSDPLQIMLVGQTVMFNELLADGARDVLSGMVDTLKLRAQSNLNGMNRALHQNLSLFLRLRDKSEAAASEVARKAAEPPRTSVPAEPAPSRAATVTGTPPALVSAPGGQSPPAAQSSPAPSAPHDPTETPDGVVSPPPAARAAEPESWIDEPYTTWIVETPAAALVAAVGDHPALTATAESRRPAEADRERRRMPHREPGDGGGRANAASTEALFLAREPCFVSDAEADGRPRHS